MWLNLIKFVAVLFLNRKVSTLKDRFQDLSHHVADYTEDRAQHIKQDFIEETERLATSMVGLLVVFSMFIFTGLLGLMWLFSLFGNIFRFSGGFRICCVGLFLRH